jgi:hypothetical protein
MVITLDDARIARNIFNGSCSNPAMLDAEMEAGVYAALADLYDTAARGAAQAGDLRRARMLDYKFIEAQAVADQASSRLMV